MYDSEFTSIAARRDIIIAAETKGLCGLNTRDVKTRNEDLQRHEEALLPCL